MTAPNTPSLITIGRIGAPHGIKGFVKITSFTDPLENVLDYPNWQLFQGHREVTHTLTSTELKGQLLLAKFEGFDTPEDARALTGITIQIQRSDLPEPAPGEYYWQDLIGLAVTTTEGHDLGRIVKMMETGANDVMVVEGDREYLIPFDQDYYIAAIDLENQTMVVRWELDD